MQRFVSGTAGAELANDTRPFVLYPEMLFVSVVRRRVNINVG